MLKNIHLKSRLWYATGIVIIAILVVLGIQKQNDPMSSDASIASIVGDIEQSIPSTLNAQVGLKWRSYWITGDGYMVAVKNQDDIIVNLTGWGDDSAELIAIRKLTDYSLRRLASAGYKSDPDNSSTSTDEGPFYAVQSAFVSPDGASRCVMGLPVTIFTWSFECVSTQDLDNALRESLPFLHALGDPKGVAATPGQEGDFAVVNIMAGAGDYAIMRKDGGDWKIIYRGQERPSCGLMNQYGVPQSIYGTCL